MYNSQSLSWAGSNEFPKLKNQKLEFYPFLTTLFFFFFSQYIIYTDPVEGKKIRVDVTAGGGLFSQQ